MSYSDLSLIVVCFGNPGNLEIRFKIAASAVGGGLAGP
jgi:hypothetical protein